MIDERQVSMSMSVRRRADGARSLAAEWHDQSGGQRLLELPCDDDAAAPFAALYRSIGAIPDQSERVLDVAEYTAYRRVSRRVGPD
jgi:hypothetical protein